jgi:hypothetical protein
MRGPAPDERIRRRWRLAVLVSLSALIAFSAPALADKRVALVVGNSAYRNVARLDNPANDAKLLAETLRTLGFTLVGGGAQLDLDKAAFDRTVQSFGAQLAGVDVGLFYYAGHGVQVRGENYLIPIDANPTKEADVDFQMLNTNLLLRQMEGAGTRLNIVILDACRNNPFGGRSLAVGRARDAENDRMRDTGGGLAQMQAPEGTLISFATQPGSVAQDGADGNSPYARALALTMRRPNLDIFQTFNQVGLAVKRATGGAQQPWVSSSPIDGSFYFVAPPSTATTADTSSAAPAAPLPAPSSDQPSRKSLPSAALTVAPSSPSQTAVVRRFDGKWISTAVCKATSDAPGYEWQFLGEVKDGIFHGVKGVIGKPNSFVFDGTIKPDGTGEITILGRTGPSAATPGHPPEGTEFTSKIAAKFQGSKGTGIRLGDRICNYTFAKQ